LITKAAHEDANIIFGYVVDEKLEDEVAITVIATGFEGSKDDAPQMPAPAPQPMMETAPSYHPPAVPQPMEAAPSYYPPAPQPMEAAPSYHPPAPQPMAAAPSYYPPAPQPAEAVPSYHPPAPQFAEAVPSFHPPAPRPEEFSWEPAAQSVAPPEPVQTSFIPHESVHPVASVPEGFESHAFSPTPPKMEEPKPTPEMKIPVLAPVEEDDSLTMHESKAKEDEYDIPAFLRRNIES